MSELSEYDKQAQAFLDKYGLNITITYLDNKSPKWDDENSNHNHYRVTIRREKGYKERFVFQFWDSIANSESGKKPTSYDVLSCIAAETTIFESFEEFCGEFGYDQDSRKAETSWKGYDKQSRKLNDFLTEEEIYALTEIQ